MKLRTVLFWTHLATGLTIGTVLFVMVVTGVLIAFEPQIVDFAEREVRFVAAPQQGTQKLSAGAIITGAAKLRPGVAPTGLQQDADPAAAAIIFFGREGAVFVNPYTGEALGSTSKTQDLMNKLIEFHRWIGSREIGKPIANACNVAFFFMIITGIFLWLPQQWNASVRKAILFFNPSAKGKARDWNWHNVIGVWCAPLLLVTTLTGLAIAYTWAGNLLFTMTGSTPPPAYQRPKESKPMPVAKVDFDKLWNTAQSQASGWQSISLRLPREAGGPVTASIVEANAKPFMRSQLTLQPETGEIMKWEPFVAQSTGKKLRSWIVPLHTGQAWGIPGQILMLIGALGAATLIWTGFSLAWRRFFSS